MSVLSSSASASGISFSERDASIAIAISRCGFLSKVSSGVPEVGSRTSNSPVSEIISRMS